MAAGLLAIAAWSNDTRADEPVGLDTCTGLDQVAHSLDIQ